MWVSQLSQQFLNHCEVPVKNSAWVCVLAGPKPWRSECQQNRLWMSGKNPIVDVWKVSGRFVMYRRSYICGFNPQQKDFSTGNDLLGVANPNIKASTSSALSQYVWRSLLEDPPTRHWHSEAQRPMNILLLSAIRAIATMTI